MIKLGKRSGKTTFCGFVTKKKNQVGKIPLFINLQNKLSMPQWKCLLIAMQ